MTDSASSEKLSQRIEKEWAELRRAFAGLSEAQLTQPGAIGEWSVKDVLAHVTTWENEAMQHLPTIAAGGRPPRYASQGGIDSFNSRMVELKRAEPIGVVLAQLEDTHRALLGLVRAMQIDELLSRTRFVRRLRLDTYAHYALHTRAIRAWRESEAI